MVHSVVIIIHNLYPILELRDATVCQMLCSCIWGCKWTYFPKLECAHITKHWKMPTETHNVTLPRGRISSTTAPVNKNNHWLPHSDRFGQWLRSIFFVIICFLFSHFPNSPSQNFICFAFIVQPSSAVILPLPSVIASHSLSGLKSPARSPRSLCYFSFLSTILSVYPLRLASEFLLLLSLAVSGDWGGLWTCWDMQM